MVRKIFSSIFVILVITTTNSHSESIVSIINKTKQNVTAYTVVSKNGNGATGSPAVELGNILTGESDSYTIEESGDIFIYPAGCSNCNYSRTTVKLLLQQNYFGTLYDYYILDFRQGFNYKVKVSPSSGAEELECLENILQYCPPNGKVLNEAGEIIACDYDFFTYWDHCTGSAVVPSIKMGVTKPDNYFIEFTD